MAFLLKFLVIHVLKSFHHVLLPERIIHEHDHFTAVEDIFIPTPQSGHAPMTGLRLAEKPLVIVVGSRNIRMVIAREQSFPKAFGIADQVGDHRLVLLFGIGFFDPLKQMLEMKPYRIAAFIHFGIQDISHVLQRKRPALDLLISLLKLA